MTYLYILFILHITILFLRCYYSFNFFISLYYRFILHYLQFINSKDKLTKCYVSNFSFSCTIRKRRLTIYFPFSSMYFIEKHHHSLFTLKYYLIIGLITICLNTFEELLFLFWKMWYKTSWYNIMKCMSVGQLTTIFIYSYHCDLYILLHYWIWCSKRLQCITPNIWILIIDNILHS